MVKFPLFFELEASSGPGIAGTWTAKAGSLNPIDIAIPAEFGGPGSGYSPEDLYGLAIINCIIAMFKVYADHSGLTVQEIKAKATLSMDKDPSENKLMLNSIDVTFDITGTSDAEKTKTILDKAIKDCPVCASIKSGKTFHINVS